jgi:chromosome segregation protein
VPSLSRSAGAVFKDLTQGRYVTLATQEEEDGRMVVVALRPDGFACPAERLSEGTRDQLYLALRLAAIRAHAGQAEPLPFIADDLLASFDDRRARATLHALAEFGAVTQTILFTHHDHIAAMADMATTELHRLPLG